MNPAENSPIIVPDNTVRNEIDYEYLIDSLRDAHTRPPALADDMFLHQKDYSDGHADSLLARVAWSRDENIGIKVATVFPNNTARPTTQASFLLFNGTHGSLEAIIGGKALTNMKTASDSALGAKFLAPKMSKNLLMIGAGTMAPDLIKAHLSANPTIERVEIYNRTLTKSIALAEQLNNELQIEVTFVEDLETAAQTADIISCATSSKQPILKGAWLKEGTHVDLVGGFTLEMREADDDVIRRGTIFVDSRRTTIGDVADIQTPLDSGLITLDDIKADLFDLCAGRHGGRNALGDSAITVFKNGGGGHLDLMTAQAIIRKLQS